MTGPTNVNVPVFRLTYIHKNMSMFTIKPSRGKILVQSWACLPVE